MTSSTEMLVKAEDANASFIASNSAPCIIYAIPQLDELD
jgi:hypothetical protein